jgi:hypothetical protein
MHHRGEGLRRLLAAFQSSGATAEQIERFLDAEPRRGAGTVRDLVAAEMSNQLLAALGQPPTQQGADAKRLRQRGTWRTYDRRPSDG